MIAHEDIRKLQFPMFNLSLCQQAILKACHSQFHSGVGMLSMCLCYRVHDIQAHRGHQIGSFDRDLVGRSCTGLLFKINVALGTNCATITMWLKWNQRVDIPDLTESSREVGTLVRDVWIEKLLAHNGVEL